MSHVPGILQPQTLPPEVDTGGLDVTAGYRAAA